MLKCDKAGGSTTLLPLVYFFFPLLVCFLALGSCGDKRDCKVETLTDKPSIAKSGDAWTELLHNRKGWIAGDGIFAIPLDGKEFVPATDSTRTLFLFSDSLIGELDKDDELKSKDQYSFVNNVVAILKGSEPKKENMEFIWRKDAEGKPTSMFKPNTPNTKPGEYYWMGDGFVNIDADSTLYIFAYRIKHVDPVEHFFDFEQVSVSLLAIPKGSTPPFDSIKQIETPFRFPYQGTSLSTFGNGIMVNTKSAGAPNPDGYIYVYGSGGPAIDLLSARVLPKDFENFDAWTFWNGKEWIKDYNQVKALTSSVSNELSVSPIGNNRYIVVHHLMGMSNEVAVQVAKSPVGPFFPIREVWHCPEVELDLDYNTYNSKGFPHLSKPGELLVSYNVNSFDFFNDIIKDPTLCRPRFISVKVN
ncbi:MAG: hypothetical protein ABIV51_00275 [Saprospiraceae bacterium]